MPQYRVEILEHINHQITVEAKDADAAMAEADRQLNELPATTYPDNFDSVVALLDTTNVEELEARFGWSDLCEEDPDEPGRCAYHSSFCTADGPGPLNEVVR